MDRTEESRSSFSPIVVGFSLLYAVAVVYYYFTWLDPYVGSAANAYSNALNLSLCLSVGVVALLVSKAYAKARIALFVLGSLFFALSLAAQFATALFAFDPGLTSWMIGSGAGLGIGFLMPLWFETAAVLPGKKRAYAIGCMAFFGMAGGMVAENLPHPFLEPTCLVLLIIAAFLYVKMTEPQSDALAEGAENTSSCNTADPIRSMLGHSTGPVGGASGHTTAPSPTEKKSRTLSILDAFAVPLLCALSLSIVYGMIDATVVHASLPSSQVVFISQFGGLAAGVIFLLYIFLSKAPAGTALINVIFGVVATGLLLLPFLPESYGISLNLIAATGWKLALLVLFMFVVEYFAETPHELLPWIAAAYALPRFGLLVGSSLPFLFPVEEGYTFIRLAAVAFFLLYLILMTVWLINARARRQAERKAEALSRFREDPKRAIREKSEALAERQGLTKRETEVMMLLAEGRDLAHICNECYLSRNTVKSYTKSIYLKLGVHSKQELIDLVDNS